MKRLLTSKNIQTDEIYIIILFCYMFARQLSRYLINVNSFKPHLATFFRHLTIRQMVIERFNIVPKMMPVSASHLI